MFPDEYGERGVENTAEQMLLGGCLGQLWIYSVRRGTPLSRNKHLVTASLMLNSEIVRVLG